MFTKKYMMMTRLNGFGIFLNELITPLKGEIFGGCTYNGSSCVKMNEIKEDANTNDNEIIDKESFERLNKLYSLNPVNTFVINGAVPL